MASRSSTRLSEVQLRNANAGNKRKSMASHNLDDEAERKKRKGAVKKHSTFNPRPPPIPALNSSNTPPEDDVDDLPLPPPPSERQIGRRRESTRAIRERDHSPSPTPAGSSQPAVGHNKKQKTGGSSSFGGDQRRASSRGRSIEPVRAAQNTSDDPLAGVEETASMRATTAAASSSRAGSSHLQPGSSATQRASPPRRTFNGPMQKLSKSTMGPPTGFVRKTRQSMSSKTHGIMDLSKESVVPLLQSETPVIRKNQELRGQQARRSSMDHRGGRASSSWGRGEITMPHKSVDSKLFYRHIPVSYPDPIKARMLLVWCANRAVEEALKSATVRSRDTKGKEREKRREGTTEEGDKLMKEIMDEFVRDMNRGAVDTSVFGLPGQETSVPGLKPHPRNVSNKKVEAETNADIRRYKDEEYQWTSMVSSTSAKQSEVIDRLRRKKEADAIPDLSTAEVWMKDALKLAEEVIGQGEGDLGAVGEFEDVEYKVDTLLQSSHVALQYTLQSTRFLDGVFSSLTSDLRSRDRLGLASGLPSHGHGHEDEGPDLVAVLAAARAGSSTSTASASEVGTSTHATKKKENTLSLLRALASAESKTQDERTVERAMQIRPVQAQAVGTSGGGVAATPRRGAATPRRTGLGQTPGR